MERKPHYRKGGTAGIEGSLYQIHLLTLFLLNGLKNSDDWYLSTENEDSGKFDDLVFESVKGDIFLQAKHKKGKKKKISYEDLLSTNSKNDDFSLPKYFFSHVEIKESFNIENVIICTNTDLKLDVELKKYVKRQHVLATNMMYYEGVDGIIYTFSDGMLPVLKEPIQKYYDDNLQKKNISREVMSDENIIHFLHQLHFIANYPNKTTLEKAIENIISQIEIHEKLDSKTASNYILKKMQDWFRQEKGIYLTKAHAKAFFCEIWSHAYCQSLEKIKLQFSNNELPFKDSSKKFWHIVPHQDIALNLMRIYRALQKRNEKDILFVSPDYDNDVKKEVIEAFEIPSYTFLIIVCPKGKDKFITQETCTKIISILTNYSYKKVILIAGKDNRLIKRIKDTNFYDVIKEKIVFSDLNKEIREVFMRKKNIVFQGNDINLKELLPPLADEDLNEIINSEMLIKLSTHEKINVGLEVTPLDENVESCYIPRTFIRGSGIISEKAMGHLDLDSEEKIILISDSAGMGKSIILTNLAVIIKENHPNVWVLKVDINNYTKILWEFQENSQRTIPVLELLNSREETKLVSDFEKKLFSMPKKVVLMIDGVDEVSPDYKEMVLNLITDCKNSPNFIRTYITTRPHLREDLEKISNVFAFNLSPFSIGNEINFLCTYWTKQLDLDEDTEVKKCTDYAQELVKVLRNWIKEKDKNTFAGVPLQVRMLAEVFQEKIALDDEESYEWDKCKEFVLSDEDKPRLPKKINLVKLYKLFMNKKRYIFMHDKSKLTGNVIVSEGVTKIYNECQLYHQFLALKIILNRNNCRLLGYYKKLHDMNLEDKNVVKLGIVQQACGNFHFMHRTFAEFFVAECLLLELKCEVQNKQFQEYLVDDILLRVEFSVIRAFFDSFLQDEIDRLPTKTFELYSSIEYKSKLRGIGTTFLHELTKESCMYAVRFFLESLQLVEGHVKLDTITDSFGKTLLHHASEKGYLDIAELLVERGASVDVADYDSRTPLHETIYPLQFNILKFLLDEGADINAKDKTGRTVLQEAVEMDYFDVTKFLIEKGADVHSKDEDGCTPLHEACKWANLKIAELLLKNNADIHDKDEEGCTPLNIALECGTLDIIQFLIENGADVNAADNKCCTALHKAAECSTLDVFEYMVQHGGDITLRDDDGCTVVHKAACPNGLDIITCLMDRGEDINIKNSAGQSALHLAVKENYLDVVRFLVEKGANVDIQDNSGCTPLRYAVLKEHLDIVKFLVESGADIDIRDVHGRTTLHSYYRTNVDVITFLIEAGADISIQDNFGLTPLRYAAQNNSFDLVSILVARGAEVNVRSNNGCTALHDAVERNNADIAKFLVENGAAVGVLDKNKRKEIQKAAERGNVAILKFLMEKDTEVDVSDASGRTPLHEASQKGHLDVVKYLVVEGGADVNVKDLRGYTALHESISLKSSETMVFLVENGADVNIESKDHYTPLLLAALEADFDKVKFLVERGANIYAKNKDGSTALHLALQWGNLDLIKFLVENHASVDAVDGNSRTVLHLTVRLDKVSYLVEKGASVNAKDENGRTPLHAAVRPRCIDVVKLLTEKCEDINAVNGKGQTALHEAIARGCLNEKEYADLLGVIKFLVKKGADINIADTVGCTALHTAARDGRLDMVQFLMQSNADVGKRDASNQRAVDYAKQKGHLGIVQFLQKKCPEHECK